MWNIGTGAFFRVVQKSTVMRASRRLKGKIPSRSPDDDYFADLYDAELHLFIIETSDMEYSEANCLGQ